MTIAAKQKVAITGSNGFVGTVLLENLDATRYQLEGFDRFEGNLYRFLNKRHLQPLSLNQFGSIKSKILKRVWRLQKKVLSTLISRRVIQASGAEITGKKSEWIKRFSDCDTVIHLAAIPHPDVPNMTAQDYERINYWGAVNIFDAAVAAGVRKFVFASSGQVYHINHYREWTKFPVHEDVANLIQKTRDVHPYSKLKWKFENFLKETSASAGVTSIALRLEFPGILGGWYQNLWIQTSVENLVQAFDKSLQSALPPGAYIFNICNGEVPAELGSLAELVPQHWPHVQNTCTGNQSLLDISRARELLNYEPTPGGTYYMPETIF